MSERERESGGAVGRDQEAGGGKMNKGDETILTGRSLGGIQGFLQSPCRRKRGEGGVCLRMVALPGGEGARIGMVAEEVVRSFRDNVPGEVRGENLRDEGGRKSLMGQDPVA